MIVVLTPERGGAARSRRLAVGTLWLLFVVWVHEVSAHDQASFKIGLSLHVAAVGRSNPVFDRTFVNARGGKIVRSTAKVFECQTTGLRDSSSSLVALGRARRFFRQC